MALIKCPECGKEISDAAVKCPNCGYPLIKEQKRQEEAKMVECPECHNMTEAAQKTCSYCGYKMKNSRAIMEKSWNNPKSRKIVIAGIVLIVAMSVVIGYKSMHNEFKQYTDYIGSSIFELPDGMAAGHEELDGDSAIAYSDIDVAGIAGWLGFVYYYEDYKISEVKWASTSSVSIEETDKIKDELIKAYGKYDREEYDDGYMEYSWHDAKKENVTLVIQDEEDGMVDQVFIEWRNVHMHH